MLPVKDGVLMKEEFLKELKKDRDILSKPLDQIGPVLFERCKPRLIGIEATPMELSHIGMWAVREYLNTL
jgi:hypothetical protein